MPARYALKITWRDGGETYLRDRQQVGSPVEAFDTPFAATTRRKALLDEGEWEVLSIDVVAYPRRPEGGPHAD